MSGSWPLFQSLHQLLARHCTFRDARHLTTLCWMLVGLLCSSSLCLTHWGCFTCSRARLAQSHQRRFRRFLANSPMEPHSLYRPLLRQARRAWSHETLYLALDTTVLWNQFCLIKVAALYRGRAVPVAWKVLNHASSSVPLQDYQTLLEQASECGGAGQRVVLLADRGFDDLKLMKLLGKWRWHFRIRLKKDFWVYPRRPQSGFQLKQCQLKPREMVLLQDMELGRERWGPVYVGIARPGEAPQEVWYVVSDEPVSLETFEEYGLRFQIEESFLDDKSGLFQLEGSRLRGAQFLSRLYLVVAIATVVLMSQGTQVSQAGRRREVDGHWQRGLSYLKMGLNWVRQKLSQGQELLLEIGLCQEADPEPVPSRSRGKRQEKVFRLIPCPIRV